MNKTAFMLLATFSLVSIATESQAQATRTWVSGVGDDVNPCSRTAPCKTFAGAISKTAARGEINSIDAGGFGAVTITKAITIDGRAQKAGVLASGVNGIIVNAGANDVVTLRNIDIAGAGTGLNGIRFLAGAALIVENVMISGFTQNGIDFSPSATSRLVVSNSTISENGADAIAIQPTGAGFARATLSGLTLTRNTSVGVRVLARSKAMIDNSVLSSNSNGVFVQCANIACEISVEKSSIFDNTNGVATSGAAATIRLSETGIYANANGISAPTGTVLSFGNNHIAGNTTADGVPTQTKAPQ